MPTPPKLTEEQRNAALAKAAAARTARAEIKKKLKSGAMTFPEALRAKDPNIEKMKVLSMLESMPGIGKKKAREMMEVCGIAESRRVQGLGPKQRRALLKRLG